MFDTSSNFHDLVRQLICSDVVGIIDQLQLPRSMERTEQVFQDLISP